MKRDRRSYEINLMTQAHIFQGLSNALVFPDTETLAQALADDLARHIRTAVTAKGECHCVFPGGRSPRRVLELLREQDLPWPALHLYPSDERCVPVGDPERNDRLIEELLFGKGSFLPAHLHSIPAELGPEEGAVRFSRLLAQTPPFDIALLGVGLDGHIASLFPGHPTLTDERPAGPVWHAPKPPLERVSLGLGRLLSARQRIVVVIGQEKRELMEQVQRGADLPVMRVQPTEWYLDAEAAFQSGATGFAR